MSDTAGPCPPLAAALPHAPPSPGVYLFKDKAGRVLYVGKAVNLKSRLSSYVAQQGRHSPKTSLLLTKISQVDFLLTRNEREALILERNLIKEHRPRFNVVLRDDKNYLCLRLDIRETIPRLALVRRFAPDGARYFGPYVSSAALREIMKFMQRAFRLRRCRDRDAPRRRRPCLNHQLGLCLAPCAGLVSEAEYRQAVQEALMFLQGQGAKLLKDLEGRMQAAAAALRFEQAAALRDRIALISRRALAQQSAAAAHFKDQDAIGLAREGNLAVALVLFVRGGMVIGSLSYDFALAGGEEDEEVLSAFLEQYYGPERFVPQEIILPRAVAAQELLAGLLTDQKGAKVQLRTARTGSRQQLVDLAAENARAALKRLQEAGPRVDPVLEVQQRLKLATPPRRMDCLDISTLQGDQAVGARATFRDGAPDKSGYRKIRLRDFPDQNDPAMLAAVVRRLYAREEVELPDLLVIDGGRGQLAVVGHTLEELGLAGRLAYIGLAKEGQTATGEVVRDRVYLPGRKNPLLLPPASPALLLLMRLRDEAHRLAVGFHRQQRRRQLQTSVLSGIPGVGPRRVKLLLTHFPDLEAIRTASVEELAAVPGLPAGVAQTVYDYFRKESSPPASRSAPRSDRNGAGDSDS